MRRWLAVVLAVFNIKMSLMYAMATPKRRGKKEKRGGGVGGGGVKPALVRDHFSFLAKPFPL